MSTKHEDIIMKNVFDLFKGDALKFFGIDKRVIAPSRTELNYIQNTNSDDYTVLVDDGSLVHLEFQTTDKKEDIERFMASDAILYYKEKKPIKTIVIYSSEIESVTTHLDIGSIKYDFRPFYMVNIDGDKSYGIVKAKIEN